MAFQSVFQRYEIKYLLSKEQKKRILDAMEGRMELDHYGRTVIRNVYFDTPQYRLIRHSIEKPMYKEKLRLRSYQQASLGEPVFVELKKKYNGIVYKRRLTMPEQEACHWICGEQRREESQIAREITYFKDFYGDLQPVIFLSYEREAYYSLDGSDFRVTFDDTILCREEGLSLAQATGGIPILEDDQVLMEIKTAGAVPLWLTAVLTREKIFKTSFSKYGTAYQTILYPKRKEGYIHV